MRILSEQQQSFIRHWIDDVIQRKAYLNFDDLHVDVLIRGIAKAQWLGVALKVFATAVEYLKSAHPRFGAIMGFSLRTEDYPLGVNFTSPEELEREFAHQPPSLYVFATDSPMTSDALVVPAANEIFGCHWAAVKYIEDPRADGDYSRSILLEWPVI